MARRNVWRRRTRRETIDSLRALVSEGRRTEALGFLTNTVRPVLDRLPTELELDEIADDLAAALTD